ncbi:protein Asterix isoform X1 [Cicer arietinum]|uniref:Protein Asterix n=1 Tax=Cicer arietinum TaxID=3827 RepID=A0A1S2Z2T6_CICAR|nr:protein Asterix [Cicer arietinum]
MSSHGNDPRQPSAAKPYVAPVIAPQDLPIDYAGFIAVIFGVAGVMFRYKLSSWLALIFCAQSIANMRNVENDLKQVMMAMMFSIMGLITNYFGPPRPGGKQS